MRTMLRALALPCLLLLAVPAPAAEAPADSTALGGWLGLFRAIANPLGADAVRVEPGWRASADLRVRQELLNDLYYFAPDPQDRNWLRVRSRAGLRYGWGNAHEVEGRLCSEFRKIRTPETELNLDEIILDQLLYRYRAWPEIAITLGRQDIRWDDGFLVMDGTPLDGSRSAYMNALRFQIGEEGPEPGLTEFFVAYNPAYDDLVLWDDDVERHLTDADETAVALRTRPWANQQLALIWKRERDPDHQRPALDAWTLGYRGERQWGATGLLGEAALQYQDWTGDTQASGTAWAMQLRLRRRPTPSSHLDLGAYSYSGRGGEHVAFRTPWGRWPKWSELMLYWLIGEDGVGQWANVAAPWVEAQARSGSLRLTLNAQVLCAMDPRWDYREFLAHVAFDWTFPEGFGMQLLVETLGDGSRFVPIVVPLERDDRALVRNPGGYFFRWQVTYALR